MQFAKAPWRCVSNVWDSKFKIQLKTLNKQKGKTGWCKKYLRLSPVSKRAEFYTKKQFNIVYVFTYLYFKYYKLTKLHNKSIFTSGLRLDSHGSVQDSDVSSGQGYTLTVVWGGCFNSLFFTGLFNTLCVLSLFHSSINLNRTVTDSSGTLAGFRTPSKNLCFPNHLRGLTCH